MDKFDIYIQCEEVFEEQYGLTEEDLKILFE